MKINKLSETDAQVNLIEDVEPVSEEKELTPEEKEKVEKFMRSAFIRKNVYTLQQIHNRCTTNKLTLEDIRHEIENKTCPLSRMQRDFICSYKLDFIQQCIDDMIDTRKRAIEHRYAVQS